MAGLLRLIQRREFDEVLALLPYYPATPAARIVGCACLLQKGLVEEADKELLDLPFDPKDIPPDLPPLLAAIGVNLLSRANASRDQERYLACWLDLEFHVGLYPEAASAVYGILARIVGRIPGRYPDANFLSNLKRLAFIDSSPSGMIRFARICLRRSCADAPLSDFAREMLARALERLPERDTESRMIIAGLLVKKSQAFHKDWPIIENALRGALRADRSLQGRIADLLGLMLNHRGKFDRVSEFLVETDPRSIETLVKQLVEGGKGTKRNLADRLAKAQTLLDSRDYLTVGAGREYVRALLKFIGASGNLACYADRLRALASNPEFTLDVAEGLVGSEARAVELAVELLEKYPEPETKEKSRRLALCFRIADCRESDGKMDFQGWALQRAARLTSSPAEFFEGWCDGIEGRSNVQHKLYKKLRRLIVFGPRLEGHRIYTRSVLDNYGKSLLKGMAPDHRAALLLWLINEYSGDTSEWVTTWGKRLLTKDLNLTEDQANLLRAWFKPRAGLLYRKYVLNRTLTKILKRGQLWMQWPSGWSAETLGTGGGPSDWAGPLILGHGGGEGTLGPVRRPALVCKRPEPPSPAQIMERHTRVAFPIECMAEVKADLIVQLTPEAPAETRISEKITATTKPGESQVTLDVHVSAPGFAIHKPRQPMTAPVDGDSEELTFALFPVEVGEQVIEIEFFQGAVRVGYALVRTQVNEWRSWTGRVPTMRLVGLMHPTPAVPDLPEELAPSQAAGTLDVFVPESPRGGMADMPGRRVSESRRTLHVSWSERDSRLDYTLYSGTHYADVPEWQVGAPGMRQEIEDYLRTLNAYLTEIVQEVDPNEDVWESLCLNLQGYGSYLYQKLIPPDLDREMKSWPAGATFVITTDEQWIPWELLHDGRDFWGRQYNFGRYPRLGDRRFPKDAKQHVALRRLQRLVNVIGGGVYPAEEAERAAGMFRRLLPRVSVEVLERKPLSALKGVLAKTDVLHCTCHGLLDPCRLQISATASPMENLLVESVGLLPIEPGCLVFANACASDLPVLTFGKFNTFGWEFYKRGAGAFIGTLGPVPTVQAIRFAEAFYRELIDDRGTRTIGEALTAAKKAAAQERNLFWLLYCLYGDPDYSLAC
jgi:hypothetical protein